MKLYVGTYKKYNEGSLFGEWLDLDDYSDKDDFIEACLELHKDEDDPELMFQDYEAENELEGKFYCECFISENYWEYKQELEDCGIEEDVIAEYISNAGYDDVIAGIKACSDNYMGTYKYFEDYIDEIGYLDNVPEFIKNYIDYDAIKRDFGFEGMQFIEDSNGNTAIFNQ